jgi:hypothetical protein
MDYAALIAKVDRLLAQMAADIASLQATLAGLDDTPEGR